MIYRLNAYHCDPLDYYKNYPKSEISTTPSFDCSFYCHKLISNAMALEIVLQHTHSRARGAGMAICQECVWLKLFKCPDPWMHKATGFCPDCENILDIRSEHHEDCAIRALCKLALTKSPEGRSQKFLNSMSPAGLRHLGYMLPPPPYVSEFSKTPWNIVATIPMS